jgi:hypothetical protein
MEIARRIKAILWLLTSTAGLILAAPASASAAPPVAFTDVSTFSDTCSGSLDCQHEVYDITATGHTVVHVTYFEDSGAVHLSVVDHGKAVAVPADGTGPTYTSSFFALDLENIRVVKHGDVLVEEDTDLFRTVAHGSDGSRSFFYFHAHFTVNANGDTTAQLQLDRTVCA